MIMIDGLTLLVAALLTALLAALFLKHGGPPVYRCECGEKFSTFKELDRHQCEQEEAGL